MLGGSTGIYTGLRPDGFGVSLNQRDPHKSKLGFLKNFSMLWSGYQEASWLIRQSLTDCADYNCAYKMLRESPITDTAYLIIAGKTHDEGKVISRDNFGVVHVDELD